MIPAIPLTFLTASLMTQSADLLLMPGMDTALNTALETIRKQAEVKGTIFLKQNAKPSQWTPALLDSEKISFLGLYRIQGDTLSELRTLYIHDKVLPDNWHPQKEILMDIITNQRSSLLIPFETKELLLICLPIGRDLIATAAYPLPQGIQKAKEEIIQALGVYNTLSLLKESIIQKNLIWGLAVLLVIGLSLASIVTARNLSTNIGKPIQNLVKGMKAVAQGDLSKRIDTRAKDEFRFLTDSFNKMTEDLQTSRVKLIQAERMAAWREVARRISHEIKNSLTPISISLRNLKVILDKKDLPVTLEESVSSVEEELRVLENMASEFSEFARMPEPQKKSIQINEVIQSVIQLLKTTIPQGIDLQLQKDPNLPVIEADWNQMKRLFHNLINNAIEASGVSGMIQISSRISHETDYKIGVIIKDQGKGMDAETLASIFNPYFTTKKKGTGLGLAITQKIVDDHNGKINVESEPGRGTTVRILL
jgi:nitrogen fixation/metabolism regulation signal transduction histidine kinase